MGPMSRPMRSEEYEPFEKKYGYHPTSFPVAVDALAVYVNKDNPVQCLTLEQLDQIFSRNLLMELRDKHFDAGRRRLGRGLGARRIPSRCSDGIPPPALMTILSMRFSGTENSKTN